MVTEKIKILYNSKIVCEINKVNPDFSQMIEFMAKNRVALDSEKFSIEFSVEGFDKEGFTEIIKLTAKEFLDKHLELEKYYKESLGKIKQG